MHKTILAALLFFSQSAFSQTPSLVKDINSGAANSNDFLNGIIFGNNYIFSADDGTNGRELWITDGTTGNTLLLKDIYSGSTGSYPDNFMIFNNTVFFRASNAANGMELWKTDGTPAGTVMVKDIFPGMNSAFVDYNGYFSIQLINVWEKNGSFFFIANSDNSVTANNDIELWKSDGTTNGTVRVKDIQPGTEGSHPVSFFVFNNNLFFTAYTIANGREMWKSDGTANGTTLVKDIYAGTNSGFIDYNGYFYIELVNVWEKNGSFYFVANTDNSVQSNNNVELWKSDGTTAGTVMVKDIQPGNEGSHPNDFVVFNNTLFFIAYNIASGYEMWKSDGTGNGTVLVKDIFPGSNSGFVDYNGYFYFGLDTVWEKNGSFYFVANTDDSNISNNNVELWKSDGTAAGTVIVKEICAGTDGSHPNDFMVFNNTLFFVAYTTVAGYEMWKTDGTSAGTTLVKDIFPGTNSGFVNYNGYQYFGLHNVWEKNGSFYFIANTDDSNNLNNVEIWKSDGTTAGTVMMKDIVPGNIGCDPRNFYVFGNTLYFTTYMSSQGQELWKTDGTSGGTVLVKDIQPGSGNGLLNFFPLFTHGNYFYFHAYELGSQDHEIWKSNGTTGNTVKLMDINPGSGGSYSTTFVVLPNDNMIFIAYEPTHGNELWVMHLTGFTEVEETSAMEFSVYPNPVVNGNITIVPENNNEGIDAVELYDVYGKKVFGKQFTEVHADKISITIPDVARGIYYLRVVSGNVVGTRKIFVMNEN